MSPDGRWLYVTDSFTPFVYRWPLTAGGALGPRETFAVLPQRGLDGVAFGPGGNVWVCTKTGVTVLNADGAALGELKTPEKPTAVAFGSDPAGPHAVTTVEACYLFGLPGAAARAD